MPTFISKIRKKLFTMMKNKYIIIRIVNPYINKILGFFFFSKYSENMYIVFFRIYTKSSHVNMYIYINIIFKKTILH